MNLSYPAFSLTLLLGLLFNFTFTSVSAQIEPVSWKATLEKVSDSEYLLKLTAETEKNWVIYSQFLDEGGPIATEFEVNLPEGCVKNGKFEEPNNPIKSMDNMFSMVLTKFKGPATFTQKISSKVALETLTGSITFMTCDDSKCLPPQTIDFTANLE